MNIETQSKDRKLLLIISAIAFSVLGIINFDELYRLGLAFETAQDAFSSFWWLVIWWIRELFGGLAPVGCVLLAIGIFSGKKIPIVIGSGINVLAAIFDIVVCIIVEMFEIGNLTPLLAWLLLFVLFFVQDKYAIFGGIGASIVRLLGIFLVGGVGIIDAILFAIGAVVFGIARLPISKKSNSTLYESTYDVKNSAEKILKLKKLLDTGIITQEEFDEKKKQLLGV